MLFSVLRLPGAGGDGVDDMRDGEDEEDDPFVLLTVHGQEPNDAQKNIHESAPPERNCDHNPA